MPFPRRTQFSASSSLNSMASLLGSLLLSFLFLLAYAPSAEAIPAFARKYGLPCSACHEAWPKLNAFGQTFKDNGYQLMNDRDAPIWQQPAYWPVAMRITPNWHRNSVDRDAIDDPNIPGNTIEQKVTTHGFDLSGLDILTGGTLAKKYFFPVGSIDRRFGKWRRIRISFRPV